jgi:hypothetical protein
MKNRLRRKPGGTHRPIRLGIRPEKALLQRANTPLLAEIHYYSGINIQWSEVQWHNQGRIH